MPESQIVATREEQKYYPFASIFKWVRKSFWTAGQDSYTMPPAQDPDLFTQLTNTEPVTRGVLQRRRGYSLFSLQAPSLPYVRGFAYRSESKSLRRLVWTSGSIGSTNGNVLATDETGAVISNPIFTPTL